MPATLVNDRFEMTMAVAGYEFPDIHDDPDDANWLIIRVVLQSIHGAWRWQVEDAGALTWELDGCVKWLRQFSAGEAVEAERYEFSEPDISFEIIRGDDSVVVGLALHLMDEFQPPTKVLVPRENNIVTLRFHTPPEVLRELAESLAAELAPYPPRGSQPT